MSIKNAIKSAILRHGSGQTVPVAVVVSGHNYGRWLGDCLDSVLRQDPAPREILYVDNGSTDGSTEIARSRGIPVAVVGPNAGHICACRNRGFLRTTEPFVVFLDADDLMAPGYLKALVDPLIADERLGFTFPALQHFGIFDAAPFECKTWGYDELCRDNFIPMPSMIRRRAFEALGMFKLRPMYQDWSLWLRILEQGWTMKYVPAAVLELRTHPGSMTAALQGRMPEYQRVLSERPFTLFTPFAPGRRAIHEHYLRGLLNAGVPWEQANVVWLDNTNDPDEADWLRSSLRDLPARGATYLRDDTRVSYCDQMTRALVVPERLAEIWTRGAEHFSGAFVWSVEDDMEPKEPNTFRRLFEGFTPSVASVSRPYYSRPMNDRTHELALKWTVGKEGALQLTEIARYPGGLPRPPTDGCTDIGATGVGCLLIRRGLLRGFTYPVGTVNSWRGQDFGVCRMLKDKGQRLMMHWGVRMKHWHSPTECVE